MESWLETSGTEVLQKWARLFFILTLLSKLKQILISYQNKNNQKYIKRLEYQRAQRNIIN